MLFNIVPTDVREPHFRVYVEPKVPVYLSGSNKVDSQQSCYAIPIAVSLASVAIVMEAS